MTASSSRAAANDAMPHIVLVNPRFDVSYWGLEHALPIVRKRAAMPVVGLPLLAALTPPRYDVRIVDENVEPLDFDCLARAPGRALRSSRSSTSRTGNSWRSLSSPTTTSSFS